MPQLQRLLLLTAGLATLAGGEVGVVDSGATRCTLQSSEGVADLGPSRSVFTGFDSRGDTLRGDADGNLHLFVDGGDQPGCSITLPVTVLRRSKHNLFSVSVIVEQFGWKLVIEG